MRTVFGLASLSVVTGFCLVQACGGDDAAAPTGEADSGGSSSGAASSSGNTSSSGGTSSSGSTDDSGPTDSGNAETSVDAGKSKMTFFVTSTGSGAKGGDLGGLAGADLKCKTLATAKGGGNHTWAAYLSTDAENAVARIGAGPWYNQAGKEVAKDLATLHTTGIKSADILDENGVVCANAHHDILTGSNTEGKKPNGVAQPHCNNWTAATGNAGIVAHCDWEATNGKWNNAHAVNNCDETTFKNAKGEGRIYCFAKD